MEHEEEHGKFDSLKLRGRIFRFWAVLSFAAILVWVAFSGPKLFTLTTASNISCYPVASGKLPRARSIEGHQPIDNQSQSGPEEPSDGKGLCDPKTLRFGDLSQPEKEVAVRINHINAFDARSNTFRLYEIDQLNADQREQLGWYFRDKAAQQRHEYDFLLIYVLGPIFLIPILVLFFIRAFVWAYE